MSGDDPYLLPGTNVLRNKLGITDPEILKSAEGDFHLQRQREGAPTGDFDLDHAKAIHRHLFQDVYEWAGQVRTVEIAKDGSQFQFRQFIEIGMADVHRRIRSDDYLRNLDVDGFARKAGAIIGDVNYAHPFREGNGRTQLEYLRQLADRAGHPLDPGKIGRDPWIAASKAADQAGYAPMAVIIREQVVEERERRNRRAAQEHMRVIDAAIDKTLADRPAAAAQLRQTAESKLDAMVKNGETIEPPKMRARSDDPARAPDAASLTIHPKRSPPDRDR